MNEITRIQPETVARLQQHIDALALEIKELARQVKVQDEFILWQAERIVELEQRSD